MFKEDSDTSLVFIKSNNVNVFPCSRRRSTPVSSGAGALDKYYIPFDPEARLNTEYNNRRHSGLNGYKQDYIYNWNEKDKKLSIVLAGYLFEIKLDENTDTPSKFGNKIAEVAKLTESDNVIYAKIVLADVTFLAKTDQVPEATTKVLRNQTDTKEVSSSLDTLLDANCKAEEPDNYYFTGLSLTTKKTTDATGSHIICLELLEKPSGKDWQIHEPSRLPAITHGITENSVSVGNLEVTGDVLIPRTIKENNENKTVQMAAASIQLAETSTNSNVWQLQIFT